MASNEEVWYTSRAFSRQFATKPGRDYCSKISLQKAARSGGFLPEIQLPELLLTRAAGAFSAHSASGKTRNVCRRKSKSATPVISRDHSVLSRSESVISYGFNIDDMDLSAESDASDDDVDDKVGQRYFGHRIYESCCLDCRVRPIQHIAEYLSSCKLCVRHRALVDEDVKPLAVTLVSNPYVTTVDLSGNMIGSKGTSYLAELLKENIFISELNLSDNGIGGKGALALCRALKVNRTLIILRISGSSLEDSDSLCIARMLMENSTLQVLDISHNKFGALSGHEIGKALVKNNSLTTLNLSWNLLRLQSGEALCTALKFNTGLKSVNLRFNGLAFTGCVGLQKALSANESITELDISQNRINDHGLVPLLDGIKQNKCLQILKMGDNPISACVTPGILNAISKGDDTTVQVLDLTNIPVESRFVEELNKINRKSHDLHVTHDVIHSSAADQLDYQEGLSCEDPLLLLHKYIRDQNLRLVDLFHMFDEDNSNTVDKNEFAKGLSKAGIHIPEDILHNMVEKLDQNGDGEINYMELLKGHGKVKRKIWKGKMQDRERLERHRQMTSKLEQLHLNDLTISDINSPVNTELMLPEH